MQHIHFKAGERGVKNIGWLVSNFTFSFSSYANPNRNGFGLLKVFNDDFVEAGKGWVASAPKHGNHFCNAGGQHEPQRHAGL